VRWGCIFFLFPLYFFENREITDASCDGVLHTELEKRRKLGYAAAALNQAISTQMYVYIKVNDAESFSFSFVCSKN
jgi:hypothetical protein